MQESDPLFIISSAFEFGGVLVFYLIKFIQFIVTSSWNKRCDMRMQDILLSWPDLTMCSPGSNSLVEGAFNATNSVRNAEESQVTVQTPSRAGPILKACVNGACSAIHDKLIRTWSYWGEKKTLHTKKYAHVAVESDVTPAYILKSAFLNSKKLLTNTCPSFLKDWSCF